MRNNPFSMWKAGSHGCKGYSMVELLTVIAVIGILYFAYPSFMYVADSAKDATVRWQEKALNNTYREYLASGGPAAADKEEALEILASHPTFHIEPAASLPSSEGEVVLVFDPDKQWFEYTSEAAPPDSGEPEDPRVEVGSVPLVLDVGGGTATYGGQDLGVGPMPTFMLSGSGGSFSLHNSGGYENIGTWHSLSEFLSDLPLSEDRFNPSSTKVLSLEKAGKRYDLEFCRWNNGTTDRLRLLSVTLFE